MHRQYMLANIHRRLGIFAGFASFFMMEKTLRVLSSGEGAGHSHSHSHSHGGSEPSGHASGVAVAGGEGLRARGTSEKLTDAPVVQTNEPTIKGPSKLSAYLNLFGDFVHNMSVSLCSLLQQC
jgi:zinc transporter 7